MIFLNLKSTAVFIIEFYKTIEVVLGFRSHSRIFLSYGDVTITDEGLQILTFARYLWPLSSEGSLACQIHCDKGESVSKGHLRRPVAERLIVVLSLPVLKTWVCRV